ncbi:MAG: hypothetical protein ACRD2C_03435, partial [Acidimicrobiales bacterium]
SPQPPPSEPSPPPGGRASRAVLVGLIAGIVVAAAVAAFLLTRDDGDGEAADGGDETATTPSTESDEDDDTTTTASDSDDGDSTGSEQVEPLPGTDWNDEARNQFVEELAADPNVQATASLTGVEPEAIGECVYSEVESSGITFDQLQEAWVAEEVDTGHPATNAMETAVTSCISTSSGG